ncbi:MAG: leucyl aminopeptidase [Prochlorococcaceae cyanobacterium]|jgi:leucyl aminopeptidase
MALTFRCSPAAALPSGCDAVALGLFNDRWSASLEGRLPAGLVPTVRSLLERRRFQAKPGELQILTLAGAVPCQVLVAGLGSPEAFDGRALRAAVAQLARASRDLGIGELALALPIEGFDPPSALAALVQGFRLGTYHDQRFRSEPEPMQLPGCIWLLGLDPTLETLIAREEQICAGVELARELVAAPPNAVNSLTLEVTARGLAQELGLELTVLDAEACRERGMGAYLAVAQGAAVPPRFLHLTIRPDGPVRRRVVLVGKGLTFDSGGYNLKVGPSQIEMMKYDMGGCGAVLGAARSLGALRPEGIEIHILSATTENMISGEAIHPGAIVTASNGKTIEINNTDAEGRLTLADALVYASGLKPDAIVDLATLTGACVIALGDEIAGLWSPDDGLAAQIEAAAAAAAEPVWRLPLQGSYKEGLKSSFADLKNTGPRPGGSITAALFLKEFVGEGIPWAHLDIAGPVWSEKGRGLDPAGATGYGVRTLVEWCCRLAHEPSGGLGQ